MINAKISLMSQVALLIMLYVNVQSIFQWICNGNQFCFVLVNRIKTNKHVVIELTLSLDLLDYFN